MNDKNLLTFFLVVLHGLFWELLVEVDEVFIMSEADWVSSEV
tara:strand:+ start:878 stop:1003 length:126 start_codon:yes stop_codon:yes gene_type:complete